MKEDKFQQLSLFDDEEEQEEQEDFNKPSLLPLEELQKIRKVIYSKYYSFSKVNKLIDFLLKLEFEDNFERWEFLSLLLELAFDDLKEDISSINTFEDLFERRIPKLEKENEIKFKKYEEYNSKIIDFFKRNNITPSEEGKFIENVNSYFEAIANEIEIEKFLKALSTTAKQSRKYEDQLKDLEDIKQKKKQSEEFLNSLIEEKRLSFAVVNEAYELQNKMFEETEIEYLSGFEASDYLQALYFVEAGIRENNPETFKLLDFFNSGLQMIKEYFSNPEEVEKAFSSNDEAEILKNLERIILDYEERKKIASNDDEIKKINESIEALQILKEKREHEEFTEEETKNLKKLDRRNKLILNNIFNNDIYIHHEGQMQEFNKFSVKYDFELIDKEGNYLQQKDKAIVNSALSMFFYNGKTIFNSIQLYELIYNKEFQRKNKKAVENLYEIESALDNMRNLTMKIEVEKGEYKEGIFENKMIKLFNYFMPLKKREEITTQTNMQGEVLQTIRNSYYKFIDIPPIIEYAKIFEIEDKSTGMLLEYKPNSFLNSGNRLPSTPENKLIEEMLIWQIILMKNGKTKGNNSIYYVKFFEDFCGIDYSTFNDKKKQTYRNKIKITLNCFIENKQILNFEEFPKGKGKVKKQGIKIILRETPSTR